MRTFYIFLMLLLMTAAFGGAPCTAEESATEALPVEESVMEEPAAEEPVADDPVVEEKVIEKLPAEPPAKKGPAAGMKATEEMDELFDKEFEALLLGDDKAQVYNFPKIKPEYSLSLGYRFADHTGSRSTVEYDHLDNSLMFAGEFRVFKFPHRMYLMFDEISDKDYFGDARYAYGDKVFFRWLGRSLFHNTGRVELLDLDPDTKWLSVEAKDTSDDIGRQMAANNLFLRLKVPHYASHAYVDYSLISKDGSMQQRGLLGSGYYNNAVRASWERDIDWKGETYKVGANSHLGPVEAQFSFAQKKFDSGEGDIYDSYSASGLRAAGTYPHHRVSELEGSASTLKLHTSYTGRLVASATFSLKERENITSKATADYLVGSGGVTWIPTTSLTLFLRYKHIEIKRDNPETVVIKDAESAYEKIYNVRTSLDTSSDMASLNGRYRPLRWLVLRGGYVYEEDRRKNADVWDMGDSTKKIESSFSADVDLPGRIGLKAEYKGTHITDPDYNTQPDDSRENTIAISWAPIPTINTSLSYTRGRGTRETLEYEEEMISDDREVTFDKVFWSGTSALRENLALSASYTYLRNKTVQDLAVGSELVEDSGYTDLSHCYYLGADYSPVERIDIHGDAAFTISKGEFSSSSAAFTQPMDVADLWDYRLSEMAITASGDYRIGRNLSAGLEYNYIKLNELLETPHDDIEDGDVQIVMIRVSNKWH